MQGSFRVRIVWRKLPVRLCALRRADICRVGCMPDHVNGGGPPVLRRPEGAFQACPGTQPLLRYQQIRRRVLLVDPKGRFNAVCCVMRGCKPARPRYVEALEPQPRSVGHQAHEHQTMCASALC